MRAADHASRKQLGDETHARPTLPAGVPCIATHQAVLHDDGAAAAREALTALCQALGARVPEPGSDHHIVDLGAITLKWERHGEFSSWTLIAPDEATIPEPVRALEIPGQRISAVRIDVTPATRVLSTAALTSPLDLGPGIEVAGSLVCSGKAALWTGLHADADGFVRYRIESDGVEGPRLGRLLRRLFEIETYRMAALLAFPLARDVRTSIDRLDEAVRLAMDDSATPEPVVLDTLTSAAREAEQLSTRTGFRFGAARAYRAIVEKRLSELEEKRIEGHQRLVVFLTRRFSPAMDTVEAAGRRIDGLAARIERASALLRTRVDLDRSAQNQALLRSMNERARLQLRLQQTVEGFSVAAISYYAFSLLAKIIHGFLEPLLTEPAHVLPVVDAVLAVVVIAVVWIGVRAARHKLQPDPSDEGGYRP